MQEAITAEKGKEYKNGTAYIRNTGQPNTPNRPLNNEANLYKLSHHMHKPASPPKLETKGAAGLTKTRKNKATPIPSLDNNRSALQGTAAKPNCTPKQTAEARHHTC